ncbi:MAG: hypothetical protein FD121_7 [Gallionellaceae bacterium]|nr:MAG: hypothetical protein FD121_7 [Gallionellaceae bacterium]
MSARSANDQPLSMGLDTLKLYPGAVMQLQALTDGAHARHEVRYIGFVKDKSLLVTLPFLEGKGLWMQEGQTFVVRGFNGIYAYAITTQVIRARSHPFPYIHFSWPVKVECQVVRHSLRVAVSLPAKVTLSDVSPVAVTMLDLSVSGAMLDSPVELGAVGAHPNIEFAVDFEGRTMDLNLPTIIHNSSKKPDGSGFHVGIKFENVSQNDGLILFYFTHTQDQKTR